MQQQYHSTVVEIYSAYVEGEKPSVCRRSFSRWVEKGSKLAAVAWGGKRLCCLCMHLLLTPLLST